MWISALLSIVLFAHKVPGLNAAAANCLSLRVAWGDIGCCGQLCMWALDSHITEIRFGCLMM